MSKYYHPTKEDIVALRLKHGITQQKLADSLYGVSVNTVSSWEAGHRNCPPLTWWAIRLTWDGVDLWNELEE